MKPDEQLEWEARAARPAAMLAFLSAGLLLATIIVRQTVVFSGGTDDEREILLAMHENSGGLLASSALQALSLLAVMGVFYYLYRVIAARKPDLPSWILPLIVGGPVLLAIAGMLTTLHDIDVADKFVKSGAETVKRAEDLRDETDTLSTALGSGGTFALALSFVLICMNALRVGILTRFMGAIGVVIGVLYVLPILGPIGLLVQIFWLASLGVLLLGHWAGGRGPAWETVEAIPWPSGMARAEEAAAPSVPPEPELESGDAEPAEPAQRRRSKKRKRR